MAEQPSRLDSIDDVSDTVWEKLSKRKIYFGHQSVGDNIIDGIEKIVMVYPDINLRIVDIKQSHNIMPGTLAHLKVGKNKDPRSKIEAFVQHINGGIGDAMDVAALKLCYIDIMADANSENIFSTYKNEIANIQTAYPDLTIVHFTVPLTTLQTGPKAWVKKILGRSPYGIQENMNRHRYNTLLREKYQGKEPILDIAMIESTYPDGTRATFEVDGKTYFSMVPEYTVDGGHLNEIGRKKVAEQLILLLADLSK